LSIERDFDIPFVAALALREKQIQQNYRPVIAVHKWFARRPGTLFRALLLAEFAPGPLRRAFYEGHSLAGRTIADPFMGGGTPLVEANRLGCAVLGFDINPMALWIVRQEIETLDLGAYRAGAAALIAGLGQAVGRYYQTRCLHCGADDAPVKSFLWVKVQPCSGCAHDVDLFPGYLLAEDQRHPLNVLVCPKCGGLNEVEDRKQPGACASCGSQLSLEGPARKNRCACTRCGTVNRYPDSALGPPRHRMFALEYYCPRCKGGHQGRFFKTPDAADLARYADASRRRAETTPRFVPDDEIPAGDETDRLHRWGYRYYREMFNDRQLLGLEFAARAIAATADERVRNALATNFSDLLRYQNMLCRYDTMALKALDIFSVHGFPVGLVQCESNLLGIANGKAGVSVGSGGWTNVVEKYTRAKAYCERPFEVRHEGKRKVLVPITGEWIGDTDGAESRDVRLCCESATGADIPPASLDAVLTDPPYFGNVQYAELMDFCYVWLRRLVGEVHPAFRSHSTRHANELTGNATMDRGLGHFSEGLSAVFTRMAHALKPGAPLAFTYHHNTLEAYAPLAIAILDAGLMCTATLPCPAEMAASIHIKGTGSAILDTVFVCRAMGERAESPGSRGTEDLEHLVEEDLAHLRSGGVEPTEGDVRCLRFGHVTRLAIRDLHAGWDRRQPVAARLATARGRMAERLVLARASA
jgi:adenine-specific DNA methylase